MMIQQEPIQQQGSQQETRASHKKDVAASIQSTADISMQPEAEEEEYVLAPSAWRYHEDEDWDPWLVPAGDA